MLSEHLDLRSAIDAFILCPMRLPGLRQSLPGGAGRLRPMRARQFPPSLGLNLTSHVLPCLLPQLLRAERSARSTQREGEVRGRMRHVLAAVVLGTMLLFGTSMAFAHGGAPAATLAHTVTNPMTDLPDNDEQNN